MLHSGRVINLVGGLVVIYVLLTLLQSPIRGAEVFSIFGAVLDPLGLPQPDVAITLTPDGGSKSLTGTTNSAGAYSFHNLKPGRYHLQFSKSEYRLASRTVSLPDQKTINLFLEPLAILNKGDIARRLVQHYNQTPFFRKSYAVVLGSVEYIDQFAKLEGVKRDVDGVAQILKSARFEILTTSYDVKEKRQIAEAMNLLLKTAGTNDQAVFYFSGHGYQFGEDGYLVPRHGEKLKAATSMFPMKEFARLSKDSRIKNLLVILDACVSGLASPFRDKSSDSVKPDLYVSNLIRSRSHMLLTAGQGLENAQHYTNGSLFTQVLLDYLKPLILKKEPVIGLDLIPKVRRLVNERSNSQMTPDWVPLPGHVTGDFVIIP